MVVAKKPRLVVIGNGMVGHRFLDLLAERGHAPSFDVTVFADEPRVAYDRVNLSAFFDGRSAQDLSLPRPGQYEAAGYRVLLGERIVAVDRPSKTVVTASGLTVPYDSLVLATGSYPFVPSIAGSDTPGCFVYRTIDDLEAIAAWAGERARTGVVVGGGLLGLEAANALKHLGLDVHVVEFAPRLMALQVDEAGGTILRRRIESLGVSVHTSKNTSEIGTRFDWGAARRWPGCGSPTVKSCPRTSWCSPQAFVPATSWDGQRR